VSACGEESSGRHREMVVKLVLVKQEVSKDALKRIWRLNELQYLLPRT
jgi:hypothetical protein